MSLLVPIPKIDDWPSVIRSIRGLSNKLGYTASPTFVGMKFTGLTANRLMVTNGSKAVTSLTDLTSYIAGTANRVTVASDGDGTVTLSGPQDIHTGASPTFANVYVPVDGKIGNADNNFQFHDDVDHITTPAGTKFGIGITPTQALTIGSDDGSDKIELYMSGGSPNNNAWIRWTDGQLKLKSTESANAVSSLIVQGNGTGNAGFTALSGSAYLGFVMYNNGIGAIDVQGASPAQLRIQSSGNIPILLFAAVPEGLSPEFRIFGYRTGDTTRELNIAIGKNAPDQVTFDGVSNYRFDGNIIFGATGKGLSYGTISVVSNANETTITTQNVYVQVLNFDTNGESNNVTPDYTNGHMTITKAGDYKIECCITANSVSGAGSTFEFEVKKNNGADRVGAAHGDKTLSGGGSEAGAITICTIATLAVNDTIELWTKNETNTQNIVIEDASLSVLMVGG